MPLDQQILVELQKGKISQIDERLAEMEAKPSYTRVTRRMPMNALVVVLASLALTNPIQAAQPRLR